MPMRPLRIAQSGNACCALSRCPFLSQLTVLPTVPLTRFALLTGVLVAQAQGASWVRQRHPFRQRDGRAAHQRQRRLQDHPLGLAE